MFWRSVVALVVAALCPVVAAQTSRTPHDATIARVKVEDPPNTDLLHTRGVAVAVNDECASATDISCGQSQFADTDLATDNPTDPAFACRFGAPGPGTGTVWFRFTASGPSATLQTSFTGGATLPNGNLPDTLLAVYSGTCGALTQIACNDDIDVGNNNFLSRITLNNLVPDQTYYIEVAAWNTGARGLYTLTISGCVVNDSCATPFPVLCGQQVVASCSLATTVPADPVIACRSSSSCAPGSAPDQGAGSVWFSFVAPSARVTISTEATGVGDSILAVYSGSCGALTLVECNDDINCSSGSFLSRVTASSLIPGEIYLIEVAAWSSAVRSDFTLTVDCAVPNDSCATPVELACNQPAVASLALATTDPSDPIFACRVAGLGTIGCNPGTSPGVGNGSVWYSFTAFTTRAVIETAPFGDSPVQPDTILQVFSESSTCGALTPIACNDDIDCANNVFTSRIELTTLIPGETYLIELAAWNQFSQQRDYTIRVDCLCPEPSPCPATALAEPEPCGQDLNSGCYQDSVGKTPVDVSRVICGLTVGVDPNPQDVDIYAFSINTPTNLAFRVQSETFTQFGILCDTCTLNNIIGDAINQGCDAVAGPIFLAPGTYDAGLLNFFRTTCDNANYLAAVYPVAVCRGDANADGVVNFLDITTVLANFGTSYNPFPGTGFGDSDSNGNVEFLDITTTLAAFGLDCAPPTLSCPVARAADQPASAGLLAR